MPNMAKIAARQRFIKTDDGYEHNFVINHHKLRIFWLKMRKIAKKIVAARHSAICFSKTGSQTKKSGHPCHMLTFYSFCVYAIVNFAFHEICSLIHSLLFPFFLYSNLLYARLIFRMEDLFFGPYLLPVQYVSQRLTNLFKCLGLQCTS